MATKAKRQNGLGTTWVQLGNRDGERLHLGTDPNDGDGWWWLRYHPGPVYHKRPWEAMTTAERRAFNARQRFASWWGYDPVLSGLVAAVIGGDLGALRPLYDRLAGGEVAGFDPVESQRHRVHRQTVRRYWTRIGKLVTATSRDERLRVVRG